MSDRSRVAPAFGRDGGRGTRGTIQQDVRPVQTARPLTREESREYNLNITERFYDDYHHSRRNTGDARNEVTTKLQKLPSFDPNLYKANAYRSLAYDPLRPVPAGLNFDDVLQRQLTAVGGPRPPTRRLSDPGLRHPSIDTQQDLLPPPPPPRNPSGRPRSALQKSLDETINPTLVPGVEKWLETASEKDRDIATKMFRTVSREGQRETTNNPPLSKKRSSGRVQSARLSEEKLVKGMYRDISKQSLSGLKPLPRVTSGKKLSQSKSETATKGGSMFTSSQRSQPSHYTIHPDWASETY